jgi:type I restriction enzyme S subunit
LKISSGATPSVQEEEKFYSDEVNGIPFLRVQNLNPNSKIDLLNLRYINKETHENYLRRSQVSEGDLLVKITGVGRMAIASVAPAGFIGNTNQHMAVIKTSDVEVSNYIANYLNLDLVEKLASRRATGATRPALDYTAIKSIPIIENIDFSIINNAEELSRQKESEAKALLESIDGYLLQELGITLPEKSEVKAEDIPTWMNPENLLVKKGRLFLTNSREVIGQRFDPKPYDTNTKNLKQAIANCKTNSVQLKSLIIHSCAGDWGTDETEAEENQENKKCLVIRATEFDNKYNLNLDNTRVKYRLIKQSKLTRMDIQENDLLIEKSGGSPDQPVGRIAFLSKEILNNDTHISYSNFIHKIRVNSTKINPQYLFYFLKTMHNVKLTETMQSQTNGIRNLIMSSYLAQNIPLPEKDKQEAIIRNISLLLTKAQRLENEAMQILKQAKYEIEQMILGE